MAYNSQPSIEISGGSLNLRIVWSALLMNTAALEDIGSVVLDPSVNICIYSGNWLHIWRNNWLASISLMSFTGTSQNVVLIMLSRSKVGGMGETIGIGKK